MTERDVLELAELIEPARWYSRAEAAAFMGVEPGEVGAALSRDAIAWQKKGGRFRGEDLIIFLAVKLQRAARLEAGRQAKSRPKERRPPARGPSPSGQGVYIVQAEGTERFKIGFTTNAKDRIAGLRNHSPIPLMVVFWLAKGTRADEAALHAHFDGQRIHGEWFAGLSLDEAARFLEARG